MMQCQHKEEMNMLKKFCADQNMIFFGIKEVEENKEKVLHRKTPGEESGKKPH